MQPSIVTKGYYRGHLLFLPAKHPTAQFSSRTIPPPILSMWLVGSRGWPYFSPNSWSRVNLWLRIGHSTCFIPWNNLELDLKWVYGPTRPMGFDYRTFGEGFSPLALLRGQGRAGDSGNHPASMKETYLRTQPTQRMFSQEMKSVRPKPEDMVWALGEQLCL